MRTYWRPAVNRSTITLVFFSLSLSLSVCSYFVCYCCSLFTFDVPIVRGAAVAIVRCHDMMTIIFFFNEICVFEIERT